MIPYATVLIVAQDKEGWFQMRQCPSCPEKIKERIDEDSKPDQSYALHYEGAHS